MLGIVTGTVLNLIADAVTRESPPRITASNCSKCGKRWPLKYLVPLAGYVMYRGKCPVCGEKIPLRIPFVEIGSGILFGFLMWRYGLTWDLAILILYCSIFIVLVITDLEHYLLPDVITYPGMALAIVVALLVTFLHYRLQWAFYFPVTGFLALINNYAVNALIGGVTGFLSLLLVVLVSRGGMGLGDVKLAGLMGIMGLTPCFRGAVPRCHSGRCGGGHTAHLTAKKNVKIRSRSDRFYAWVAWLHLSGVRNW